HLAGFLLTLLLRERLEASGGVVINTSSSAHQMGRIDLQDMESERRYNSWSVYGATKVMNILHAAEINRRFRGVRAVSFHPGVVATALGRESSLFIRLVYAWPLRLLMIPP